MKLLAIVGAIVAAWISGAGLSDTPTPRQMNASVLFLMVAIVCGLAAWGM